MHKYPKHFTVVNPSSIDSVLSTRSTAELEEQIKKELEAEKIKASLPPSGQYNWLKECNHTILGLPYEKCSEEHK